MSENSKIEWTDHTFNPWEGCSKVSPGCANCYAEARNARFGGGKATNWGKGAPRRRTSAANWRMPLKWNREVLLAKHQPCGCVVCTCEDEVQCQGCGASHCGTHPVGKFENPVYIRPRVFCASLADWLDEEVPIEWLADLLQLIHDTPNLDWQLLTKRPENWRSRVRAALDFAMRDDDRPTTTYNGEFYDWVQAWLDGIPPNNVWIGTTVENQEMADRRIPQLLGIPANVRFLSCEPLLGPVDLRNIPWNRLLNKDALFSGRKGEQVDWVICGGESGPHARPMHPDWARSLRDQCQAAGVPFFFKQWGEFRPTSMAYPPRFDALAALGDPDEIAGTVVLVNGRQVAYPVERVGKKSAGRILDGREHNEFPEVRP